MHETMSVGRMTMVLVLAITTIVSTSFGELDKRMVAEAERIVSQYKTLVETPPKGVPSRDLIDSPIMGNGDLGVTISGKPEAQRFWISKNNFWRLKHGHRQGGPRLFGGLEINIPALSNSSYRIEQDIYPAITLSTFTNSGCAVTMRSVVAATEDVLLIELSVAGKPVEVETRFWAAPGRGSVEDLGRKDGILWATKAYSDTNDVAIPTAAGSALRVMGCKVTLPEMETFVPQVIPNPPPRRMPPLKAKSQPGPKFTLQPGSKVMVAVAMKSSFDAKDPLAAAQELAIGLNAEKIAKLLEQHAQWWREFWAKSLVEIGNPVVERAYYMSNYLLGSSLRDPEFPTGLFGICITDDDPRWAGDYHLNFDYQSQFYSLYKGNQLEQADCYEAPVLAFMDRGRAAAKDFLKMRGVYYVVGIGPKGIQTCHKGTFLGQKSNAAYCLANMAMRWYHTYDLDYAKKVYPFVQEVANFWEDFLVFQPLSMPLYTNAVPGVCPTIIDGVPADKIPVSKLPQGRYVIYNDSIHENMHSGGDADVNAICSLGLAYNTFTLALEMSAALGVDADRKEKWQHIVKNLSKWPTQEKDGKTVFRYTEKGTDWFSSNTLGIQHIYPAGAMGLDDDPKLLEIARNTVTALGRWSGDNGENSLYPAAARVGYDPNVILEKLTMLWSTVPGRPIGGRKWPSGLPEDPEQCSTATTTINEMLCMGHQGVLRVFPVWPKNKDAQFWTLRAEGAFLVSSALKGGEVKFVKITSEKGRACTLVNPWPGKSIDVYRDGKKVETLRGERVVMKTETGTTVVLGPEGKGCPAVK